PAQQSFFHVRRLPCQTRSMSGTIEGLRCPVLGCELEAGEAEAGCHRAADQGPVAEARRRLPPAGRHDLLRPLPVLEIRAETALLACAAVRRQGKPERGTRIPVPDLGGIDAVPVRALA